MKRKEERKAKMRRKRREGKVGKSEMNKEESWKK